MKQRNLKNESQLKTLVVEYEVMSQQGTVGFLEETVFLDIASYYENQNMIDNALDAISHAIEQNNYSPMLLVRKAELLLVKNCVEIAMGFLDRAELLAPGEISIKILKIEVMINQGHYNKALVMINDLEDDINGTLASELFFLKAHVYEAKRKYVKMFQALRKSVKENPKNDDALKKLWLSVELSGCFEESVTLHNAVIDDNPYSAIAWYNLGHAYLKLEEYCDAEEAFEYAFLNDKNFEEAYRDCAEVRVRMKDYESALDCYEEMLTLFKPDSALFINIGYCYEQMEKLDLALICYEKSFKYSHLNDWAYFRKGYCLLQRGEIAKAIQCLEEANNIQKNKVLYMNTLAEAYYKNGEEEKANDLFYKATGAAPDLCTYWISYARFLMNKGKVEEALVLMKEAEIYAMGADLLYCKTACFFFAGKRKEGFEALNSALGKNYKLHYSLFELCPVLKEDSDVLIAISTFKS